jgi:ribosomal protein L37AE/L43A
MKTPREQRFSNAEFNNLFPTDEACVEYIFKARYGKVSTCPSCKKETKFFRIKTRKVYSCEHCGYQISPLADTIFHKSSTSMKNWFYAIYPF